MNKVNIEIQTEYNPQLAHDYNELLASLHSTYSYRHSPEDVEAICKSESSDLYLAKIALRAVGMAILVRPYKTFENNIAVIEDVAVSPEYKGNGIGEMLLRTLIDDAKDLGATRIELHSNKKREAARSMYEKNGFVQIDTDLFRLGIEK